MKMQNTSGLIVILLIALAPLAGQAERRAENTIQGISTLSLAELMEFKFASAAALLSTEYRDIPAPVTILDQRHIEASGARNLDELLDIYVPGFQFMRKNQGAQIGIRGIISDRNNKMLMLVNGRNLNVKVRDGGASTERGFSMLGDIKQITVVRSPGSAVAGPGAIAGVIDIETYNGLNFSGLDLQVRGGAVETFVGAEGKYGRLVTDEIGLFVYYGLDWYDGAKQKFTPMVFSTDFTTDNGAGTFVPAGKSVPFDISNDFASFNDLIRHKAYLELTGDEFEIWLRYTRGGEFEENRRSTYESLDPAEQLDQVGAGYQQLTLLARYEYEVRDWLDLEALYSFDFADTDIDNVQSQFWWREDEHLVRLMATIDPGEHHDLALGFEYSHEIFGKPGLFTGEPSIVDQLINARIPQGTEWDTDTYSLLSEYQWSPSERWRAVLGLRTDTHTYTPWMLSPRVAVIHTPTDRDTIKLMYNRSVRRSDEVDLLLGEIGSGSQDKTETIDNIELSYERLLKRSFLLGASVYYNIWDVVSFNGAIDSLDDLGKLQLIGIDLEFGYHTEASEITFSHNYTKHLDFDLKRDATGNNISASPYGFGDDLANWSKHISKLAARHDLGERFTMTGSLRIYWGYPGGRDLADYHAEGPFAGNNPFLPRYDEGKTRAFGVSAFLNLGLEYRASDNVALAVHGYNLLGLADKDINKRNYFQRTTQYRSQAPAIAFTVRGTFGD